MAVDEHALKIMPLDATDADALAAWHATYLDSTTHGREFSTPWMLEEVRAELTMENPGEKALAWSGVVGDQVAVTGMMALPLKDNLKQAWIEINTLPSLRNRGYGSAMLEQLVASAREHDRTVLVTEACYPYDLSADGSGHPYVEFLRRRGFTFGLGDVQRVLDLPVDEELLQTMVAKAAPHHEGYGFRQFAGSVPDDIIDSFGELIGSLITEAPTGEIEFEPEVYDRERIRADEVLFERSGRTKYTTVAVAGDGTVAAYTELVVPEHDPGRVYQWGTLAHPAHRGHRLGQAVKARNLLWLQQERPDLKVLSTYNAEVNQHMIAVNELMGFRPVERLGEFQRKLD
jgi:RimJ/RimL family protein N-acetyltransferase